MSSSNDDDRGADWRQPEPTIVQKSIKDPASGQPPTVADDQTPHDAAQEETAKSAAGSTAEMGETAELDALRTAPSTRATVRKGSPLPRIEGYEILGELGRGGMGVVYKARQVGLNRIVALKVIRQSDEIDQDQLQRFQREAEAVAQLQHPNIVQIHEVGTQPSGLPFFSLEYVEGGSFDVPLRESPLRADRAAELVETLARAMHFAHERGIVHRDLKPGNVLLTGDWTPKITDFGLVKRLEDDSGQTRTGAVVGTPNYMAPEQGRAEKDVGPLADVYALGAILYASLTGRPPFLGSTAVETVMQVLREEPVPPTRLQPGTPKDLETICLKCLQKDPQKRYHSALEMAEDLRRFSADEPILASPVGRVERSWRWCRRNPRTAITGGIAASLAFILMTVSPIVAYVMNDLRSAAVESGKAAEAREQEAILAGLAATAAREEAEESEEKTRQAQYKLILSLRDVVMNIQAKLEDRADMQDLRKQLLNDSIKRLGEVAETVEDTVEIDVSTATAFRNMGEIYQTAGEIRAARQQFLDCHQMVVALIDEDKLTLPEANLANSFERLGKIALTLGDANKARQWFEQSLQQRQAWVAREPTNFWAKQYTADSLSWLGRVALLVGDPQSAMQSYRRVEDLRRDWVKRAEATDGMNEKSPHLKLAGVLSSIGDCYLQLGDAKTAIDCYDQALAQLEPWSDETLVSDPANRAIWASKKADAYVWSDEPASAIPLYLDAESQLRDLVDRSPDDLRLKRTLASVLYGLGAAYKTMDPEKSQDYFDRTLALRRFIYQTDVDNFPARVALMLSLARTGKRDEAVEHAEAIRDQDPQDIRRLYQIACCYALCADGNPRVNSEATATNAKSGLDDAQLAIESLQHAISAGFKGAAKLQSEPDLSAIQDHPEFGKLIDRLMDRANRSQSL